MIAEGLLILADVFCLFVRLVWLWRCASSLLVLWDQASNNMFARWVLVLSTTLATLK